jgi:antitoxin VapB
MLKRSQKSPHSIYLLIYTTGEKFMQTAKLFRNGQSQAVRLPKEFRFEGEGEVFIKKMGNATVLFSTKDPWAPLLHSLKKFSEDFMETRDQPEQQDREDIFS